MSLLIINNHDSFTFNLVDYIRWLNVPFQVVNVEELDLDAVGDFSHLLISPGPDVPRAYPQLFELLARYQHSKSILGVCLGHQMLCEFFGAELHNLPSPRHGQAKRLQCVAESLLFKDMPQAFQIGLYHSWAVSELNFPSALQITARCDDNIIMAMQHKTLPIYGVQFHPESYISEYGEQILRNWLLDS